MGVELKVMDEIAPSTSTGSTRNCCIHPGLKETLASGGISVRRTEKLFSGVPIDLTLEQTINADAANKLTGINSFTNSISARRRWAASHSLRTSLVTHLLEKLQLNSCEDVTNDLRNHKIKKDNFLLKELVNQICNTLNPFSYEMLQQNALVNLSTGRSTSELTKDFLLNIVSNGEILRDEFIAECKNDPSRFEKPISRQIIHTFASENKLKVKKIDGKIAEVKVERNLFGRILVLALEHKIDLLNVLSFPLTTVPLSLCHIDGSMNKTDKSKLFKLLEKRASSSPVPDKIDCTMFDGFFFLHLLGDIPATFGRLALHILTKLCRCSSTRIDLIFDKFVTPSIKDSERDRRAGVTERSNICTIVGEDQKRPNDFLKAMRNDSFKAELVQFLINYWKTDNIIGILEDKILRVNCQNICYMYYEQNGHIKCEVDQLLCCDHSEADTRILFHVSKLPENTNVVVRASDTDIMIIALGNMHRIITNKVTLWMETGIRSKNTLRYINVNSIYTTLGENLSRALPAYHALTGSDYTASFARKGKTKIFSILEKDSKTAKIFASFGTSQTLSDEQIDCVEKLVCKMYGRHNITNVNEARFDIFMRNYGTTSQDRNPLDKIKNFDGSLMPPCRDSLICKIKRVNQICAIWNFATEPRAEFYNPEENGWSLLDKKYQIQWFLGPQTPSALGEISATPESSESDDESYDAYSDEEDY